MSVVVGKVIEDNREERFVQIAEQMVETTTEYEFEELPIEAQEELIRWVRDLFYWAMSQR